MLILRNLSGGLIRKYKINKNKISIVRSYEKKTFIFVSDILKIRKRGPSRFLGNTNMVDAVNLSK